MCGIQKHVWTCMKNVMAEGSAVVDKLKMTLSALKLCHKAWVLKHFTATNPFKYKTKFHI